MVKHDTAALPAEPAFLDTTGAVVWPVELIEDTEAVRGVLRHVGR